MHHMQRAAVSSFLLLLLLLLRAAPFALTCTPTRVQEPCLAGYEQCIARHFCAAIREVLRFAAHQQQRQRTPYAGLSPPVTVVGGCTSNTSAAVCTARMRLSQSWVLPQAQRACYAIACCKHSACYPTMSCPLICMLPAKIHAMHARMPHSSYATYRQLLTLQGSKCSC
jgi:hypothetical protein